MVWRSGFYARLTRSRIQRKFRHAPGLTPPRAQDALDLPDYSVELPLRQRQQLAKIGISTHRWCFYCGGLRDSRCRELFKRYDRCPTQTAIVKRET